MFFHIFINDLAEEVEDISIVTKLCGMANILEDRNKIQSDLEKWAESNTIIKFNRDKCKWLLRTSNHPDIEWGSFSLW